MSSTGGRARTGEIKRTAAGWAIRYRDGRGVRRQVGGFRTKGEAKQVLDEELRRARLGPVYRPNATLQELADVFLEQYQGAPSSRERLRYYLGKATAAFGSEPIGELTALDIARWRARMPETMRHGAHRALRQVLTAAVKWQWIERNVATDVSNPLHARAEFQTFGSWEEVEALARELGPFGPLAIFCVGHRGAPRGSAGDGLAARRPGGACRDDSSRVREGPAQDVQQDRSLAPASAAAGQGGRRAAAAARREGILFPAAEGGRIDINNWRSREWGPAFRAAGLEHRRIYDMRHTFAAWSLDAGMGRFTLARRMGTSVRMIDATYGHLVRDADEQDRELLDTYDAPAGT